MLIFHKVFDENLCNAGSWAWRTNWVLGSTEVQVEIILSSPTSSSVTNKLLLNVALTWCKELWNLTIVLPNSHLDNCYFLLRGRSERKSEGNLEDLSKSILLLTPLFIWFWSFKLSLLPQTVTNNKNLFVVLPKFHNMAVYVNSFKVNTCHLVNLKMTKTNSFNTAWLSLKSLTEFIV